jgi:hypothetical protein
MSTDPAAEKLAEMERLAARLLPLRGPAGPRKPHLLAEHVAEFVPPLIGAAKAALELHGPGPITILGSGSLCRHHESSRFFSITTAEADAIRACPNCAAATWVSCAGCGPSVDVDECPTRAVIARELTAERGDGA